MKLSMIFGLGGAAVIPIIYEIYANVSMTIGLVLAGAWVLFAGIRLSGLSFKEAMLAITCVIAYTGILGFVFYLIVHPLIMEGLIKRSVYFQLSLQAKAYFVMYCFFIFLGLYAIWLARFGLTKAFLKLKSNSEKAGSYIDNAFDDDEKNEDGEK
ncbi:MAG: hypothetical protein IJ806_09625 [Ruminococcus sp.]|nr:hypothetical protein [Ruminococcus sp.]